MTLSVCLLGVFDAEQLARVARPDPKLLHPIQHRAQSARADLAKVRSRDILMTTRTSLINHVRGVLRSFGARVWAKGATSFHGWVEDQIPEELRDTLRPSPSCASPRRATATCDATSCSVRTRCSGRSVSRIHFGDLRRWGLAMAGRGGKTAKKEAVIALARKLAVLLHTLWKTGSVYEPLRVAERRAKRTAGGGASATSAAAANEAVSA